MLRLLLILLVLAGNPVFAQGNFFLKAMVSPTLDYRIIQSDGTATSDEIVSGRNRREEPIISYRLGCLIQRELTSSLRIETGFTYSVRGWTSPYSGVFEGDMDPSGGFGNNNPITQGMHNDQFKYVEVPLHLIAVMGQNKLKYTVGAGVSTDLLVGSPSDFKYNPLNVSPIAMAGVLYTHNQNHAVGTEVFFRSGVLTIIDAPITGYLWTSGIQLNYLWKIH